MGANGVAATGDDRIEVIQRLALTPDRRGEVDVTIEAEIPEPVVDLTVSLPAEATVVATEGFRRENATTYEWTGGGRRPQLRYRFPVNETQARTGPLADDGRFIFADTGEWAIVPRPGVGVAWRTRQDVTLDRGLAVEGRGVAGTTMAFLGPHETFTREVAGQRFTLAVPRAAALEEPPERILGTLAGAARSLEVGDRDETVLGIVAPTTVAWAARGLQTGETDFWGQADEPVADPKNVWIHEYVHTRQEYEAAPAASWFTEGGATYYAALLTLQQGHIGTDEFLQHIAAGERGDQADSVLSRPDTWQGNAVYRKGALAAGILDLRLRTATDRRRTLEDVFRRLNAHNGPIDAGAVRTALREVGGATPVNAHDQYVTSSDVPSTWDATTHRDAFGRPPVDIRYVWAGSDGLRVSGPYRNASLGDDDPIRIVPGETLQVTAQVRNEGTETGSYEATLELGGETIASASGRLASEESTTLSGTYTAETPGRYQLAVGDLQRQVVVREPASPTVTGVEIRPRTLATGDRVTVQAMVTNEAGELPARRDVVVEVDGEAVSRSTVTLGPGDTERLEWTIQLEGPGEYTVGVRGDESVTVTVERSGNDAPTTDPGAPDGDGPSGEPTTPAVGHGLGVLVGVAALVATIGLGARRRR